jgi:hypothetical protein
MIHTAIPPQFTIPVILKQTHTSYPQRFILTPDMKKKEIR